MRRTTTIVALALAAAFSTASPAVASGTALDNATLPAAFDGRVERCLRAASAADQARRTASRVHAEMKHEQARRVDLAEAGDGRGVGATEAVIQRLAAQKRAAEAAARRANEVKAATCRA